MSPKINEYIEGAPPVTVTGLSLMGVSLQDWVFIITIIYTLLAIAHKLYTWKKDKNGR